jgi:hypothetical protein
MADNINLIVNETIENITINPSIINEIVDINIGSTDTVVNISVTPNLTTVNINTLTGVLLPVTSVNGQTGDVVLDIPSSADFIPYIGATSDVNLGEFGIQLGNLEFDLTPTNAPTTVGSLSWNNTDGTLDLKLKGGNTTLQIGQETVARIVNKTATNITLLEANYQAVRVTGAQGQRPKVDLAQANNDLNSTTTLGLVTETILNNQEGFITTSGQVKQINTTGSLQGETWLDGDVLYLSGTVAGRLTNIKPIAPIHTVIIGFVEYAHAINGKIFVKVDNGYELEELHNVSAIAPNNNEVLAYDLDTALWKPKTVIEALGYTPYNVTNPSGYTTNLGTVTNVSALTLGTSGTDLSSTVSNGTTTPVITLNVPTASALNRGVLSSADWISFNNKQGSITPASLTKINDTNVTLTLGGSPTNALLENVSLTLGWNGTLADSRIASASVWNAKQNALIGTGFVKSTSGVISYDTNIYLTTINGISAGGELSGTYANPSLLNSAVTNKILTGVNITGGTILSTDSMLTAFGKLQNQVNGLIGGSIYQSVWNASTNSPTLTSSVGTKGYYYIVSVDGTTNLNGITDWKVGDWAIFNGTAWNKVDNSDSVSSVNGFTGAVSLTTANISEVTNLYYTEARVNANTNVAANTLARHNALTLSATSNGLSLATQILSLGLSSASANGALSSTDWITFNNKATDSDVVHLSGTEIITGSKKFSLYPYLETGTFLKKVTSYSIAAGYTTLTGLENGIVIAPSVNQTVQLKMTNLTSLKTFEFPNANGTLALTTDLHNPITIGTANGLSLTTQVLSLGLSSSTTTGALSSTDWTTFNNKLTLPTLTSGSVLFSNGTTIAQDNANFFWDDTNNRLGIGTITPVEKLNVVGNALIQGNIHANGGYGIGFVLNDNFSITRENAYTKFNRNTNYFSLTDSGFGIGITNPSQKLHVVGNGLFTGSVTASSHITSGGTARQSVNGDGTLSSGRKIYRALISQTGTDAPTVIILENTIGAIVWTRAITGIYTGTLTNAFTVDKTFLISGTSNITNLSIIVQARLGTVSTVNIATGNSSTGSLSDGNLVKTSIEIIVYD